MPATSIRCSANLARSPPSGLERLIRNEPSPASPGGDEMQRDRGGVRFADTTNPVSGCHAASGARRVHPVRGKLTRSCWPISWCCKSIGRVF